MASYIGMKYHLGGIISVVAPFVGEARMPYNMLVRVGILDEIITIDFARKTWRNLVD